MDRRSLNASIDSLANMEPDNVSMRLAALDRLADTSARYDTIDQKQSILLAGYLLSNHDPNERLEVQRAVPKIAKWNRLLLAVADAIPDSDVSMDQALTLTTLLTNNQFDLNESDWRKELSLKLFNFASETIAFSAQSVDPVSPSADWLRLEKFLGQAYRNRVRLLSMNKSNPLPKSLPTGAASLAGICLVVEGEVGSVARRQRIVEAINQSTQNDLLRIVLCNHILADKQISAVEERLPAARRLLLSELELLNMWNQQRKQSLRQLIQRRMLK